MRMRVDTETFTAMHRYFPEACVASNELEFPVDLSLSAINQVLQRNQLEAWSRFPGMSLRVRSYPVRVRGGREALQWREDPERMAKKRGQYPCQDELFGKALKDKRAEILARLSPDQKNGILRTFDPDNAPERARTEPREQGRAGTLNQLFSRTFVTGQTLQERQELFRSLGQLVEYVISKSYAAKLGFDARMRTKLRRPSLEETNYREGIANAGASYIREMLRETSFARKILPPEQVVGP